MTKTFIAEGQEDIFLKMVIDFKPAFFVFRLEISNKASEKDIYMFFLKTLHLIILNICI